MTSLWALVLTRRLCPQPWSKRHKWHDLCPAVLSNHVRRTLSMHNIYIYMSNHGGAFFAINRDKNITRKTHLRDLTHIYLYINNTSLDKIVHRNEEFFTIKYIVCLLITLQLARSSVFCTFGLELCQYGSWFLSPWKDSSQSGFLFERCTWTPKDAIAGWYWAWVSLYLLSMPLFMTPLDILMT